MLKISGIALFSGVALLSVAAFAAEPVENVNPRHHPHLAHAQKAIENASTALDEAQKANEFDLDGHAAKAKDLLDQADVEIKQAANSANQAKKAGK